MTGNLSDWSKESCYQLVRISKQSLQSSRFSLTLVCYENSHWRLQ